MFLWKYDGGYHKASYNFIGSWLFNCLSKEDDKPKFTSFIFDDIPLYLWIIVVS